MLKVSGNWSCSTCWLGGYIGLTRLVTLRGLSSGRLTVDVRLQLPHATTPATPICITTNLGTPRSHEVPVDVTPIPRRTRAPTVEPRYVCGARRDDFGSPGDRSGIEIGRLAPKATHMRWIEATTPGTPVADGCPNRHRQQRDIARLLRIPKPRPYVVGSDSRAPCLSGRIGDNESILAAADRTLARPSSAGKNLPASMYLASRQRYTYRLDVSPWHAV